MQKQISHIEELINGSRYFEAHHLLEEALRADPDMERLQQLKALTLSKLGNVNDALDYFEPIWRSHQNVAESAGIMGSIYKARFISSESPNYGRLSAQTYLQNFKTTQDYYTGINAATMSKLTGDSKTAKEIAASIIELLNIDNLDFWQEATLAEAYLLMRETEEATNHFIKAREKMGANWGAVNSVKRQMWLLDHYIKVPQSILGFFQPPVVAAFVGHMIDAPDRKNPRFSPDMENEVRSAIRSAILTLNIQIGYCSLACGADILFAEEMVELKREVVIYIPFDKTDFIQTSVAFAGDQWVERFEHLINTISRINYITTEPFNGDDYNFRLLAECISGAAILRSKFMATDPLLLAVLSQFDLEHKTGGARDLINNWPNKETIHQTNIDIYRNAASPQLSKPEFTKLNSSYKATTSLKIVFIISIEISEDQNELINDVEIESDFLLSESSVDSKNILQFSRFSPVLRLTRKLLDNRSLSNFKVGIDISFVNEENPLPAGNNRIDSAIHLCENASANSLLITESLALLFAANNEMLEIEYAGELKSNGNQMGNVYRVANK